MPPAHRWPAARVVEDGGRGAWRSALRLVPLQGREAFPRLQGRQRLSLPFVIGDEPLEELALGVRPQERRIAWARKEKVEEVSERRHDTCNSVPGRRKRNGNIISNLKRTFQSASSIIKH